MQREQVKQKTISKQNHEQTQYQNIAKTMNIPAQKEKQADEKEKIARVLSRPRSKRYIALVQKNTQLNQRYRELEARRNALTGKSEKEAEKESETGWQEIKKEALSEHTFGIPDIEDIAREMSQIEREIMELGKALEREAPICSKRLGFIYSGLKEQELINRGVISAPGTPYFSVEGLLDQVKPQTEHEEKQWKTGNQAYHENDSETLLIVEIYWAAVCVVWEDGSVKCYQD